MAFASGVAVRSFVLERAQGNIIVYNSPGITAAAREILKLGQPDRLLVSHCREAMYAAPDLDVTIFVDENDRGQTHLPVAGTFTMRESITDDFG